MAKRTVNQWHYIIEGIHNHSILLDTREIFLSGDREDSDDLGIDHIVANRFIKNLRLLETQNATAPIVIHQNTVGGVVSHALAIYDAIANCKCKILFVCHGEACSAGSLIPQACVKHGNAYRVVMPHCSWMIHQGNGGGDFTHKQLKSYNKAYESLWDQCLDIYVDSFINGPFFKNMKSADEKKIRRFVQDKLDEHEDWYFSAKEAVEYGLADAVMGDTGFESIDHIFKTWEG